MLLAICFLWPGCASPESRIAENPELFASFPADVQEKVRQGQIEVGFTKGMVTLAQGPPDRRLAREEATGVVSESWIYTDVYYTHVPVYRSHRFHRSRDGHCDDYYFDRGWDDIPHPYDRLKLHFDGDRVVSIDLDER